MKRNGRGRDFLPALCVRSHRPARVRAYGQRGGKGKIFLRVGRLYAQRLALGVKVEALRRQNVAARGVALGDPLGVKSDVLGERVRGKIPFLAQISLLIPAHEDIARARGIARLLHERAVKRGHRFNGAAAHRVESDLERALGDVLFQPLGVNRHVRLELLFKQRFRRERLRPDPVVPIPTVEDIAFLSRVFGELDRLLARRVHHGIDLSVHHEFELEFGHACGKDTRHHRRDE